MIERADEAITEYVSKRLDLSDLKRPTSVSDRRNAPANLRPRVKKPLTPAQKRQRYEAAIAASKKRKRQHRQTTIQAARRALDHAAGEASGIGWMVAAKPPLPYHKAGYNPVVGKAAVRSAISKMRSGQ